uniref:Uncharacterized protein n=1 Tax=Sphaerodactylus townsendi TaxID=933632 RepID=A0ACB8EPC6_9SAUR
MQGAVSPRHGLPENTFAPNLTPIGRSQEKPPRTLEIPILEDTRQDGKNCQRWQAVKCFCGTLKTVRAKQNRLKSRTNRVKRDILCPRASTKEPVITSGRQP